MVGGLVADGPHQHLADGVRPVVHVRDPATRPFPVAAAARPPGPGATSETGPAPGAQARHDRGTDRLPCTGAVVAAPLGLPRLAAAGFARRLARTHRRRAARDADPARAGPPAPPRPLGARAGVRRHGVVLVEPRRLVRPPRAARGGGAVLRRLGGVVAAAGQPHLRHRAGGNDRIPLRRPRPGAAAGERYRTHIRSEQETYHDYAWDHAPQARLARRAGRARPRGVPPAAAAGFRPGPGQGPARQLKRRGAAAVCGVVERR